MGGFLKVMVGYPKIVEGFLKVAKRLFQSVLSERLGTQNFYCEKRVPQRSNNTFPQCKQNVYATFPQRFQRLQNVLSKRLETQNLIAKKEFLDVKNVPET